jgi:phosphoglycerate kinase
MLTMDQYDYHNKRVLLRLDLNVPVLEGDILDDTRINKAIPTIKYLLEKQAQIIIITHFGRPKSGYEDKYSVKFLAKELSKKLGVEVSFDQPLERITLLENIRFSPGETKNDLEFTQTLAKLADYYVNDAFSCCHRAHASIVKIAELLPSAAGLLLQEEINNLNEHLTPIKSPSMAIIGGSKVSTKLSLLQNLIKKVDYLVIGGAMANTFLAAQNYDVGGSLIEADLIDIAKEVLNSNNCQIILPQDVVVAKEIKENAENHIVDINSILKDHIILDIGPESSAKISKLLEKCNTVIMNGPLGVFEHFPFSVGTTSVARTIAKLTKQGKLISIAGGGDIVAALSQAGLFDQFTYISTAGGAFLEWLEGKTLPGIKVLDRKIGV